MSLPEEKFDASVWYVLKKIKEKSLFADTEKRVPYFVISEFSDLTNTPCSPDDQISVMKKLERDKIVKIIKTQINEEGQHPDFYIEMIQPAFNKLYEFHKIFIDRPENEQLTEKATKNIIPIKNIRLDASKYFLEINNGEKIISFKSKKGKEGLEKETKQFKVLYHLWDLRWELKNNRVITKGDFASLDNLTIGSGSKNVDATSKHIQRLNACFKKESLSIKIEGKNGKYRLIIVKA